MPKVKIQKIVDAAFAIGIIALTIIATIHIIQSDDNVSFAFVLFIGIFITGILINLIVKAVNSKIETWKKKIMIAIYLLEVIALVYCLIVKDFTWMFVAIIVNFQLELFKKKTKDNID